MTDEIKQKDRDIRDNLRDVMEKGKKYTTKELSKELSRNGNGGRHYLKQRLHIHREWFPKQVENLETFTEEDETGGEDTRYWRLVE